MKVNLEKTALMVYLKKENDMYYGKIFELRNAVQAWLEYVPQSFPHYTRHTIQHSDEIVLQLSKLLFKGDDPAQPVIRLSAVEIYILIVSAYLHDIGMVISDSEKLEILSSSEWKEWTGKNGGGYKRWVQIEEFRKGLKPSDEVVRNFLADIQTRFLVAEFVRRQHHLRARKIIALHHHSLGQFALDDPLLMRTIVNVCVAHALSHHELEDNELYPDRCDIQSEKVNTRLLAILLRIGDLLDMSHDRACPLLLNAASPLPAESLAHWTKYQRIVHRMTAPDRIELSAECHTQEEHRFLQDWCQWLVDEVREASVIMSRATRHNNWVPPTVSLEGPNRTINIRPTIDAKYIPSRWTFNLDEEVLFQRLMKDIYKDPMLFVLELVQNALDANRCQMYIDLENEGLELPEYPTQVEKDRRLRYPVRIILEDIGVLNELSGEIEPRQVLTIEDCGIGMDKEIIERFFLQVGRSFYQTEQFRRSFKFISTSQFGMGFLSVFAVSDNVIVETYKPSSKSREGSIRLTLRGPRNYLLTEHGERRSCGTCIRVVLRAPIKKGKLMLRLKDWCKRVEFPILVDDLGEKRTISAERAEQFTYELPDLSQEGSKLILKAFPINHRGIEGELYIFVRADSKGELWDQRGWARAEYPRTHPAAYTPEFPEDMICRNGIKREFDHYKTGNWGISEGFRLDVRRRLPRDADLYSIVGEVVSSRVEEILNAHLATESRVKLADGWIYKQNLMAYFPHSSFWKTYPKTIRLHIKGQTILTSLKDALTLPTITITLDLTSRRYLVHSYYYRRKLDVKKEPSFDNDLPTLTDVDLDLLSRLYVHSIFKNRKPNNVRWLKSNHLAIDWELSSEVKYDFLAPPGEAIWGYGFPQPSFTIKLSDPHILAFYVHKSMTPSRSILLNLHHSFIQWLLRIRNSQVEESYLEETEFNRLLSYVFDSILYHHDKDHFEKLQQFIDWLRISDKLPKELLPPHLKFTKKMFILKPP